MNHEIPDYDKNMANHADTDSNGIDSCCANDTSEAVNNSDKSTKNLVKFSIYAISQTDAFSQTLKFAGNKFYIYSNSPPLIDGLLASVIKKE